MKLKEGITHKRTLKAYENLENRFNENRSYRVTINCSEHGLFSILPDLHIAGAGCRKCSKNHKLDTYEYVEKAKLVFPNYNFSKTEYTNMKTKILEGCNIHKDYFFEKNLVSLLQGYGCPKCYLAEKISKGSFYRSPEYYRGRKTIMYYIKIIHNEEYYKIGLTVSTIEKRYKREDIEYSVIEYWEFEDGHYAALLEQEILLETMDLMVENNKESKILPSGGGSSEIRTEDIFELINTNENLKFGTRKGNNE